MGERLLMQKRSWRNLTLKCLLKVTTRELWGFGIPPASVPTELRAANSVDSEDKSSRLKY